MRRLNREQSFKLRDFIEANSKWKRAQKSDSVLAGEFQKSSGIGVSESTVGNTRRSAGIGSWATKRIVEKSVEKNPSSMIPSSLLYKSWKEQKKIRRLLEKLLQRFEKKSRPSVVVSKVTPQ